MDANKVLNDIFSADELKRLDALYLAWNATDIDLRGAAFAIGGLMSKYAPYPELLRDLLAVKEIVDAAMGRNASYLLGIGQQFLKVNAERQAATAQPEPQQDNAATLH